MSGVIYAGNLWWHSSSKVEFVAEGRENVVRRFYIANIRGESSWLLGVRSTKVTNNFF